MDIARQVRRLSDPFQLAQHQSLPRGIVPAPPGEGGKEAGGDLRVQRNEAEQLVRQESVAGAVRRVEAHLVAGKGPDQGPEAVGIAKFECRMVEERDDLSQGAGEGLAGRPSSICTSDDKLPMCPLWSSLNCSNFFLMSSYFTCFMACS